MREGHFPLYNQSSDIEVAYWPILFTWSYVNEQNGQTTQPFPRWSD